MIPILFNKDMSQELGKLTDCVECYAIEERNGLLEIELIYPNNELATHLATENIIICDVNDTLKSQQFRIYETTKFMSNQIQVMARHISFDLAYDVISSIKLENASCEYALRSIFAQSRFNKHYGGYSDIINAQDFSISECTCLEAISGKAGSVMDTYGTGPEILRDNTDIYVYNHRGLDRGITIEYAKNLTGFELEEDTSELATLIIPYAIYTDEEETEHKIIVNNGVQSPLIESYVHPYITYIDYSDRFEEEIPTEAALIKLAEKEFSVNKKDRAKQNFKIEFIPLSKCAGYEGLDDAISLCDTVTIIDTRYNIDTKAKVIKTTYDVLRDRYDSMELGEPRSSLNDIIAGVQGEKGDKGDPGEKGEAGSADVESFPDTLPDVPILTGQVYGFGSIELSWTYESKIYYEYELYASTTKDFTPNSFDLIHAGQSSSFLFQAEPNQTWYFRVCAINSHGRRTAFSDQLVIETVKIDDLENYFTSAAIGEAIVGSLTADYMTAGIIKGHWIDAKNLSVTDGNGKRTLDIDSFGNVTLDVSNLKISSKSLSETYATTNYVDTSIAQAQLDGSDVDLTGYVTETQLESSLTVNAEQILSTVSATYTTKTEAGNLVSKELLNSAINQKADSILSTVSKTYATTDYVDTEIANAVLEGTDIDLSGYVTEVELQSAINQKADSILSTVSGKYQTKDAMGNYVLTTDMNSAINQKSNSILSTVSSTYQTQSAMSSYPTTTQMNSAIEQKANSILTTVSNNYVSDSELDNVENTLSSVQQTANKINWLVKSGTSSSNMVLTDQMLNIVSNQVNIDAPKVQLTGSIKIGTSEDGSRSAFEVTNKGVVSIGNLLTQNGLTYASFKVENNGNLKIGGASAHVHSDGNRKGIFEVTSQGTIYSCSKTDPYTYTQITEGAIIVNNTGYNGSYFLDRKIVMENGEIYITGYKDAGQTVRAKEIAILGNVIYSNMYDHIEIQEGIKVAGHTVITQNAKAYKGVDTSGYEVALAHVGGDNVSRFGYGSWNTDSSACYDAGTEYLGGASATLRAMDAVCFRCNSTKRVKFFLNSEGNYAFRPDDTNKNILLGTSTYPWKSVTAVSVTQTSDRTLKENIKYISNANTIDDNTVTLQDCYNFIKNDLPIATYNYKEDETKSDKIGFIAQDLLCNADGSDNKVGQLIIDKLKYTEEEGKLTYDTNNLFGVMLSAMQVMANEIELLKNKSNN